MTCWAPELTYVLQDEPVGTGGAALLGLGYLLSDSDQVLVTYADTPLLRPDSLLGLFTRHRLKGADLSILTAVIDDPDPSYGRVLREGGRITAILEGSDLTAEHDDIPEVNVGGYVATPGLFLGTLAAMAAAGEHRLTDLARRVINSGGRVHSYQIHDPDEVQGINTPEELALAEDIVLKRLFVPRKNTDTKIVFGTGAGVRSSARGTPWPTCAGCARRSPTRPSARAWTPSRSWSVATGGSCPATPRLPPPRCSPATTSLSCCCPTTCPPRWSPSPRRTWGRPTG